MGKLERLKQLAAEWDKSIGEHLNAAFDRLGFTEQYVKASAALEANPGGSRVIKDNVWGLIHLRMADCRLLDTPLLQKLRWIRQLGMSYLVYPSAEHSRFQHTIGVYHVVREFLGAVKDARSSGVSLASGHYWDIDPSDAPKEAPKVAPLLCDAALLHDVGHLPFSHVLEKAVSKNEKLFCVGGVMVRKFTYPAKKLLGKGKWPLAECLSLAVVLSERFRRFYSGVIRRTDPDAVYKVAALIAGIAVDPNNRALPDIISSGLDADKIDYLRRDALACGIPLGIDVARIFHRSAFISLPFKDYPKGFSTGDANPEKNMIVFVVNASGMDTVEEMAQARMAMYHRVYFHHKTRTAERMIEKALTAAARDSSLKDVLELWTFGDDSLLRSLCENDSSSGWSGAVRNRQLPRRAGVFRGKLFRSLVDLETFVRLKVGEAGSIRRQIVGSAADLLKENNLSGDALELLEREIEEESIRIRDLLKEQKSVTEPPEGTPGVVVLPCPNTGSAKSTACIVLERDGTLSSSREHNTSLERGDAGDISMGAGAIYSEEKWREIVLHAFRRIVYDKNSNEGRVIARPASGPDYRLAYRSRLVLDLEKSARSIKLPASRLAATTDLLERAGYFDNCPALAGRLELTQRLSRIAERFSSFEGQHSWRVTTESVRSFIEQFRPRFRNDAMTLLEKVQILERETLRERLDQALESYSGAASRVYLAPFSPNSGNFITMIYKQEKISQLKSKGWDVVSSLREVLGKIKPGETVILCDDNMGSGSQAECQLNAWLDVPRAQWPDPEEAGVEEASLAPNEIERLREVDLALAVCYGTTDADQRLRKAAEGLDLKFLGVFQGEPLSIQADWKSELPELADELREIGKSILLSGRRSSDPPSPKEQAFSERNALGYGNQAALLVTMFNVPTSTVTALHRPGVYKEEAWVPLFFRRGYFDRLVLS